jgi:hypothetical protein
MRHCEGVGVALGKTGYTGTPIGVPTIACSLGLLEQDQSPTASATTTNSVATLEVQGNNRPETEVEC